MLFTEPVLSPIVLFAHVDDRHARRSRDRLAASAAAREWFGEVLLDAYLRHKRSELTLVGGFDPIEQCRRYAEVY